MNRIACWLVAVVALAAFFALGFAVVGHGEPSWLMACETGLHDRSTAVAWWLTWACYPAVLLPLGIGLLIVAWRVPSWRTRILFSILMLVLCWRGADLFQHFFMRPRRLDWVVKHERSYSYPSSHAAIAVGFYLLWAALLAWSELPRRVRTIAPALLALLTIGICWSRLALGAHYLTDLAGGALLAAGFVAIGLALLPVRVFTAKAEL